MGDQLHFIVVMLLQLSVIAAVLVALHDVVRRALYVDDLLAACATVVVLGIGGYAAFWLAYASYPIFGVVKIAVLFVLVAYSALLIGRRGVACIESLKEPLTFTLLFCVAVLAWGLSSGGHANPVVAAATPFGHAMGNDNILSMIHAESLRDPSMWSTMGVAWLTSDRPPLQAGLYLLLALKMDEVHYQIVASFLQASFLFGAWAITIATGLDVAARRVVLLGACLLPTAIFNTFYTWPKLLSVSYLLIVFALIGCRRPARPREQWMTGVLAGSAAALAQLSHGTAAFLLIGLGLVIIAVWQWPSLRTMVAACGAIVGVYAPWTAYQTFVDPPGNRLLKWHLAGVIDVDSRSFGQALCDAYGALTWSSYLDGRIENVRTLIGPWPRSLRYLLTAVFTRNPDLIDTMRRVDFTNFLPALHGFSIALLAAILLLPRMRAWPHQQRVALLLLGTVLATCVVCVVLLFVPGGTINHQTTYATHIMAELAAMIVLATCMPMLALGFIALQTATVATLYGGKLLGGLEFWPTHALCLGAIAVLYSYTLVPIVAMIRARSQTDAAN